MIRIGRLRPVYALQLQHAVTSNLSRIGTQRPPSVLAPRQLRCYVASGGQRWKLLFKSVDKDDAAVAELTYDGESFVTYILSDPAVNKILDSLKTWLEQNPNADKAESLAKLTGDSIVDALQGYRQKVPKPAAGKNDVTAYPLENAFSDIGKIVAFIPGRAAPTPFNAVRNAMKCKKERDTRLLFVFEDEPDAIEPPDYVAPSSPNVANVSVEAETSQVYSEQIVAQIREETPPTVKASTAGSPDSAT